MTSAPPLEKVAARKRAVEFQHGIFDEPFQARFALERDTSAGQIAKVSQESWVAEHRQQTAHNRT